MNDLVKQRISDLERRIEEIDRIESPLLTALDALRQPLLVLQAERDTLRLQTVQEINVAKGGIALNPGDKLCITQAFWDEKQKQGASTMPSKYSDWSLETEATVESMWVDAANRMHVTICVPYNTTVVSGETAQDMRRAWLESHEGE